MKELLVQFVNTATALVKRKRPNPLLTPFVPGALRSAGKIEQAEWDEMKRLPGIEHIDTKNLEIDLGEIRRWSDDEVKQEELLLTSIGEQDGCESWNQWRTEHPDIRIDFWKGVRLPKSDLRGADLSGADLREANFKGADLRHTNFQEAMLCKTDFRDADLRESNLRGADLRWSDLAGADLRHADLRGAHLVGAILGDAKLKDARLV